MKVIITMLSNWKEDSVASVVINKHGTKMDFVANIQVNILSLLYLNSL